MIELDCVAHCDAACCKFGKFLRFSRAEAATVMGAGTVLTEGEIGRDGRSECVMQGGCKLESAGLCTIYELRPRICREFKAGSKECLKFRAGHPEAVKARTPVDISFQSRYFGEEDY